ncbi:MAG: hypothetical protein PHV34_06300 [Verrucomicrobiae bacterium]|nr:hypothetical protein [Verrucomicrobiae bacterium]
MSIWHKGCAHYHTCFHRFENYRLPESTFAPLKRMGAGFVFCAGDHGDADGSHFWGFDTAEWTAYSQACAQASEDSGIGRMVFDSIDPIPSAVTNHAVAPRISAAARCLNGKPIRRLEIYRDGLLAHDADVDGGETCEVTWEDRGCPKDGSTYFIHAEAEGGQHLFSGPIRFEGRLPGCQAARLKAED